MIRVRVNRAEYLIPSHWHDLTIGQAARLSSLEMPSGLAEVYREIFNRGDQSEDEHRRKVLRLEAEMEPEMRYKAIPKYYRDVVGVLSDIPGEILDKTDINSITHVYMTYFRRFVEGVNFTPDDFTPELIKSFDFEGETYYLPKSKKVFGEDVPMSDAMALEFTESADLMVHLARMSRERDFSRCANLVSILCRPDGEQYNEDTSLQRAERFKRLTMDVVWNVFFSLIVSSAILGQFTRISFLRGLRGKSQTSKAEI